MRICGRNIVEDFMGAAAVFLDRDGVINEEIDYVHTIDQFKFIEHAIDAMKIIKDKGYALIVVTNQSGIARGYYTEEDFLKLTEWMDWSLQLRGVRLDGIYYCPHHPTKGIGKYLCDCDCRKPKPGMFYEARDYRNLDLAKCYMVGDKISDVQAGLNAGIKKNYLVRTGHKIDESSIGLATGIYDNLLDFAKDLPELADEDKAKSLKPVRREDGSTVYMVNESEPKKKTTKEENVKKESHKQVDIQEDEEFQELTDIPDDKIFVDLEDDDFDVVKKRTSHKKNRKGKKRK